MRVALALLLCSWVLLAAPRVRAQLALVTIVAPDEDDTLLSETVVRLRAELRLAGFETKLVSLPPGEHGAFLRQPTRDDPAIATCAITRSSSGHAAIDVWVFDRMTQKTSMRRIDVRAINPALAAEALAIRTVELVRSSFLELNLQPSSKKAAPLPVRRWLEDAQLAGPPSMVPGPAAQLGFGALHSFRGVGPALSPVLRVAYGLSESFALRASLVGPALGARVESSAGHAEIRQEFSVVEVTHHTSSRSSRWRLVSSVGLGGYHLRASGTGKGDNRGQNDDLWALLVSFGLGASLSFGRMAWLTDAHLLATYPGASIDLAGVEAGVAGRPSFLFASGLVWKL